MCRAKLDVSKGNDLSAMHTDGYRMCVADRNRLRSAVLKITI